MTLASVSPHANLRMTRRFVPHYRTVRLPVTGVKIVWIREVESLPGRGCARAGPFPCGRSARAPAQQLPANWSP